MNYYPCSGRRCLVCCCSTASRLCGLSVRTIRLELDLCQGEATLKTATGVNVWRWVCYFKSQSSVMNHNCLLTAPVGWCKNIVPKPNILLNPRTRPPPALVRLGCRFQSIRCSVQQLECNSGASPHSGHLAARAIRWLFLIYLSRPPPAGTWRLGEMCAWVTRARVNELSASMFGH